MYRDEAFPRTSTESLAVGLGWFSIALGVAELAAPRGVARFIGIRPTGSALSLLRSYGAREVGTGLAILAQPDRPLWLWSRVAGDAVDLATLGAAMNAPDTDRGRAMFATAAVLGVTALDALCARQLGDQDQRQPVMYDDRQPVLGTAAQRSLDGRVRIHETVTINAPIERVEDRWANLASMPESLRALSRLDNSGDQRCVVEFRQAPGARGTEVRVEIEYMPRGGAVGRAVAGLLGGDPTGQVRQDIRRFKQIVETGEVVLSDGPSLRRPAQPAADPMEIRKAAGVGV